MFTGWGCITDKIPILNICVNAGTLEWTIRKMSEHKTLICCMLTSLPWCVNLAPPLVNYSYNCDGAEAQRWQRQGMGVEHTSRLC